MTHRGGLRVISLPALTVMAGRYLPRVATKNRLHVEKFTFMKVQCRLFICAQGAGHDVEGRCSSANH